MDGKTKFIRVRKELQSAASTKYAAYSFIECVGFMIS